MQLTVIIDAIVLGHFAGGEAITTEWPKVVRIFSLTLVPHALSVFLRSFFQVLNCRLMGMIFSSLQALCMVMGLWVMLNCASSFVWWSFPLSAFLLVAVELVFIFCIWSKRCNYRILPVGDDDRAVLELSVEYEKESVINAINQVCNFLEHCAVNNVAIMAMNICCEELMLNIVTHQSHKQNPSMDLHITVREGDVSMVLKDAGRPFNPVLPSHNISLEDNNVSLGLTLVNNVCTTLSHKYMYGQNVVFAEFKSGN